MSDTHDVQASTGRKRQVRRKDEMPFTHCGRKGCGHSREMHTGGTGRCVVEGCACHKTVRKWRMNERNATKQVYDAIKYRCYYTTHKHYKNYGGRGIKMCARWRESFDNFLADMGIRPGKGYSIDRIDGNADYSPENCRWATWSEQNRNKRTNRLLTAFGETLPMSAWAERYGLRFKTLDSRLKNGWTPEEAVSIPVTAKRRYIRTIRMERAA